MPLAPPICFLLLLGACTLIAPARAVEGWRWDRADATEETFAHDRRQCLRGATRTADLLPVTQVDVERFAACMAVRGYTRSETGQFGLPPTAQ